MTKTNWTLTLLVVVGLVLATASMLPVTADENENPGVLPPHSKAFGKTYGEWAAAWWQWADQTPWYENPILDETGEFGDQNQGKKVWFLAGTFGGAVERDLEVPAGTALFFPMLNAEGWGGDHWLADGPTVEDALAYANYTADLVTDLFCEVDGVALENPFDYRAESPGYPITFPEESVIHYFFGLDEGPIYFPYCAADGYWVMLAPLAPGEHTIHFGGYVDAWEWGPDVTYNITVVPGGN